MKIYFIDDALFQEYQQEKGWFCFPAQDREDTRNRGGLEGKVRLADGSEQLLVCYPSLPQKRETKSDNWEEFETQEFLDNGESPEMLHPEPNPETKGAVLEDPESEQEQTDQTQGDPESVPGNFEQEEKNQQSFSRNSVDEEGHEKITMKKNDYVAQHTPYQPHQNSAWGEMQGQQHVNPMFSVASPNQQQWGLSQGQRNQNTMPPYSWVCQRCGRHWGWA